MANETEGSGDALDPLTVVLAGRDVTQKQTHIHQVATIEPENAKIGTPTDGTNENGTVTEASAAIETMKSGRRAGKEAIEAIFLRTAHAAESVKDGTENDDGVRLLLKNESRLLT